jgi:hypothetical protein
VPVEQLLAAPLLPPASPEEVPASPVPEEEPLPLDELDEDELDEDELEAPLEPAPEDEPEPEEDEEEPLLAEPPSPLSEPPELEEHPPMAITTHGASTATHGKIVVIFMKSLRWMRGRDRPECPR